MALNCARAGRAALLLVAGCGQHPGGADASVDSRPATDVHAPRSDAASSEPTFADPRDSGHCGPIGVQCLPSNSRTLARCEAGRCIYECATALRQCSPFDPCTADLQSDPRSCDARVTLDARPIAPLSTARLGGQRPRFRWRRAAGVDGVRLQLCADRVCERVERVEDIVGDAFRPPVALSPGPHFWRLFARRGTVLSTAPSPVWEFIVPPAEGTREVIGYTPDLDGDALPDTVTQSTEPSDWSSRTVTRVRLSTRAVEVTRHGPAAFSSLERDPLSGLPEFRRFTTTIYHYVADVDGDGFGDLIGSVNSINVVDFEEHNDRALELLRGGDRQIAMFPVTVESISEGSRWTSMNITALGDIDGDGYADLLYSGYESYSAMVGGPVLRLRFGGPSGLSSPSPEVSISDGGHADRVFPGDFNGDGIVDIAAQSLALSSNTPNRVRVFLFIGVERSQPIARVLFHCPAAEAAGFLSPEEATIHEVRDVNGDGFDDLRAAPYWHPADHGLITWFGGPDGLSSDRCAVDGAP